MKGGSGKNESKKRKRDDSQEPISESPKKAKVHAQRKFAQGAAFNSPVITPIKDKVRPPAAVSSSGPMLTGKCPNTEDFLTFLCFRRTSILPAKLDFFKDGIGTEVESSTSTSKANSSLNHKSEQAGKQGGKKNDKNPEEGKKSHTPAVQALRRKYQEQRLAKQKATNVTRLARKVKGKNMVRTRSSTVEETKTVVKKASEKGSKGAALSGLRSGLKRIQTTAVKSTKKTAQPKNLRAGLRSGGSVAIIKPVQEIKSSMAVKKTEKETKKAKSDVPETKTKMTRPRRTEGFSDFSSDDNEPLLAVKKPKTGGRRDTNAEKIEVGKAGGKTTVKTRSRMTEAESTKTLLRPTRKTKEAAALYMEMITKKLVSPEKSGDEDMSSVDSFPELPNAKRNEQRETEIKAKAFGPGKKSEPKQKPEEKTPKDAKKGSVKKNEPTAKLETKNVKDDSPKKSNLGKKDPKTNVKQEDTKEDIAVTVKRSSRASAKEEPTKAKQVEEEKRELARPSTRSRQQQEVVLVVPLKKTPRKITTKKSPKDVLPKEPDKRPLERTLDLSRKSKLSKEEKSVSLLKSKGEVSEPLKKVPKDIGQESSPKAVEPDKPEPVKSPPRKPIDKKVSEVKEKPDPGKKKGRKSLKPNETDLKSKKPKVTKKKLKKDDEVAVEDPNISKRPTRKCSAVDKIWIDIDGFTSDEDDFLEVPTTVTKTRASTKKDSSTGEKPNQTEKKSGKVVKAKVEVIPKTEEKKIETKKGKSESKPSEEAIKPPSEDDKNEKKNAEVREGESVPKKIKKETKSPEKAEMVKANESPVVETPAQKETQKEHEKEENKDEKKGTVDAKTQKKLSEKKPKGPKMSGKGKGEVESRTRTRPVRQCSTGEKRWIETDSDSFSFYETSDEEDNLPIVDFSKMKTNFEVKPTETEDKTSADNFSESDEEPLKKKANVEDNPPPSETETKVEREVPGLTPLTQVTSETQVPLPVNIPPVSVPLPEREPDLEPEPEPEPEPQPQPQPQPQPAVHLPPTIPIEPKPLYYDPRPQPMVAHVEVPKYPPEPIPVSVPNRIEMILHSLKRDKMTEGTSSHSNDVKVTFGNVPYQPMPHTSQIPVSFQVKATFPTPREPISTHGLDLLSEVALPTTPKESLNSQTKRIEKWLNDSLVADQKARFPTYDTIDYRTGTRMPMEIPTEKPPTEGGFYYGKPVPAPVPKVSSHSEFQKFGQMELLESQKLLKKNLFEVKQDTGRIEPQQQQQQPPPQTMPKKAVTSVQDLLKLQKERKEIVKTADNAPHLKNCKCNNCVVKKGWFKNKPVPKADQQKSSSVEDHEDALKPFESLTKAFIGEGKNSKMSVSVAPMVVSPPPTASSSKDGGEKKGLFQQRKLSFLERMKERERKEAAAAASKPSPNAFSPNNESSVYAFEPEPEQSVGTNTPFRSKTRESRASSTSASRSDDETLKICEDEIPTVTSGTQVDTPTPEKVTTKASQSASIAVQVNLDSETVAEVEPAAELPDGKSIEISTQTEVPEEDSDSPMFYIPLQQATAQGASASSDQQLIQGVALKLGTEGPMGPNQRVIMKAKLVTKPPDSPSIKAVVMPQPKRLFDQKYNNPPIGTVQPTTRKPPDEPASSKPESAKPVIPPAKESPETVQNPSDTDISKTKTTKPSKNKDKPTTAVKEKPEVPEEHSPCSSASSTSKSKRPSKQKSSEPVITPTNSTWLPPAGTPSKLVEAPTFHPTEKEFQDPFEFFERIRPAAEKFGLCRIVPPSNFKPDCKVSDDMRFTAYNQYVHRMFHRWGPNIKEMMAIKKYLATQSISLKQPPWIGGIEVDLPRLYQKVQSCGGLMKVMEKKKWHQVADMMKIPKAAQDRVTKLDDIYCKYLLPYDTLSHDERQKLFDEVEKDWTERQKTLAESQDNEEDEGEENYIEECEECVVKGRNMALNQFYRIARNTMSMWFKSPEPSPREVETEFWKHVSERNHHVCVHSGSIDSSGWGYGFPIAKNNSFSKHPWNLKVLTNNSGSVLRYLGPVMGVTVPTLHVGMVFTAFCWYRDPHGLPWIEYLHTGAPKIWYGISDDNSTVFQEALTKLLPRYIKSKTIWLPSDTAMIPPELLVEHGVSLCHTVQEPGQFILVFPRAFTSSICTGYLVSESVYFAQLSWLSTAEQVFKDIQESCEPSMFSLEKLLFSIATDSRSSAEVLKQVLPMVWHVRQKEIDGRKTLFNLGLKASERLPAKESGSKKKRGRWAQEEDGDYECEVCRTNLYVSLVTNSQEEGVYCLPHAIDLLTQKRHQLKYCKLMYTYTQEEMNEMVEKLEQRIESKSQKKPPSKPSTSSK